MAIRKKQEPDEYQKALRKFHKKSNRHVVVFEADISEDEKRRIFSDADHLRKCGNELIGIMERNLEQLLRTKRYRALQTMYAGTRTPPMEPQWLAAGLSQSFTYNWYCWIDWCKCNGRICRRRRYWSACS